MQQSVLTTQRTTEQYRTFTPFDNMRKRQRANKIMVQVYAAALNIEDFHIVNGWAAGYNLWKFNPYEAVNKAYSRSRGRPTNLKSESNHGGYTEKGTGHIFSNYVILSIWNSKNNVMSSIT